MNVINFIKSHVRAISAILLLVLCFSIVLYYLLTKPSDPNNCPDGETAVRACGESKITCQKTCGLQGYNCSSRNFIGKYECNQCNVGRKWVDGQCCDKENIKGNKCCSTPLCGNNCCAPDESCVNGTCMKFCGLPDNTCTANEICISMEKASAQTNEMLERLLNENHSEHDKIVKGKNDVMYACVKKDGDISLNEPDYMPAAHQSNHSNKSPEDDSQHVFPCFLFDSQSGNDLGFCSSKNNSSDGNLNCGKHKTTQGCSDDGNCDWKNVPSELGKGGDIPKTIYNLSKTFSQSTGSERSPYGTYCLVDKDESRQKRFVVHRTDQKITDQNRADAIKACFKSVSYNSGIESVDFKESGGYGYCIGTVNCKKTLPVCGDPCPVKEDYFEDPETPGNYPFLKCEGGQFVKGLNACEDGDPCLTIPGENVASTGECLQTGGGNFRCTKCPWYVNAWPNGKTDCNNYGGGYGYDGSGAFGGGNRPEYTYRKMKNVLSDNTINTGGQANTNTCKSALENSDRSYYSNDKLWADGASTYKQRDGSVCRMRWENQNDPNNCYHMDHYCNDNRGTDGHVCKKSSDDNSAIDFRCLRGQNQLFSGAETARRGLDA
jgi:hypothetical protein